MALPAWCSSRAASSSNALVRQVESLGRVICNLPQTSDRLWLRRQVSNTKPDPFAQTFLRPLSFLPLFERLKKHHGKSPQQEREHESDANAELDDKTYERVVLANDQIDRGEGRSLDDVAAELRSRYAR